MPSSQEDGEKPGSCNLFEAAELPAHESIVPGSVEAVTSEGQRASGVANALHIESRDLLPESPLAQQHVLRGHIDVVEIEAGFTQPGSGKQLTTTFSQLPTI